MIVITELQGIAKDNPLSGKARQALNLLATVFETVTENKDLCVRSFTYTGHYMMDLNFWSVLLSDTSKIDARHYSYSFAD
jgi:hypothetical protein